MQTIGLTMRQVQQAAGDLRAAGLDVNPTNIDCWLKMPDSQRRLWRPECKENHGDSDRH